jgi:TRAP-type C4-dicarboxylate transport system permease small subunit
MEQKHDAVSLGGEAADLDLAGRALELRNPDEGRSAFDKTINRIAETFGVALLGSVFLIIFINAVGRYLTGLSLAWGEEVVIGVIPWLSVTGLFLSVRRRELIRITFFEEKLPERLRSVLAALAQILCCGLFAFIGYLAFFHVQRFGGDLTPVLSLPRGITYAAMLVGGTAIALAFAFHLVQMASAWKATR